VTATAKNAPSRGPVTRLGRLRVPRSRADRLRLLNLAKAHVLRYLVMNLPPGMALNRFAAALERAGQHETLVQVAKRRLAGHPSDHQAARIAVRALCRSGRPEEGLAFGLTYRNGPPDEAMGLNLELARTAIRMERLDLAQTLITAAARSTDAPSGEIDILRARFAMLAGENASALALIQGAERDLTHCSADVIVDGAEVCAECGDWQMARALCRAALVQAPADIAAMRLLHALDVRYLAIGDLRGELAVWLAAGGIQSEIARPTAVQLAFYEDRDWVRVAELAEPCRTTVRDCAVHLALALAEQGERTRAEQTLSRYARARGESDEVLVASATVAGLCLDPSGQIERFNRILERHGMALLEPENPARGMRIEGLRCGDLEEVSGGPLVSVILAVHAMNPLLDHAIGSILGQTYRQLELLLVDDGSSDDTLSRLEHWAALDPRVHTLRLPVNCGPYIAKNTALAQCEGDLITFMDGDDWSHPQRIARQVAHLDAFDNLQAVFLRYVRIDATGQLVFRRTALKSARITLMMRRETFRALGYFDALRAEADSEYTRRIGMAFGRGAIATDPGVGLFAHQHAGSLTGGGGLALSWRPASGPRQANRIASRAWHRREHAAGRIPYVPHPMTDRPYPAPPELLARLPGGQSPAPGATNHPSPPGSVDNGVSSVTSSESESSLPRPNADGNGRSTDG
jgi:tetratricopeptide (TPR) repeat protein